MQRSDSRRSRRNSVVLMLMTFLLVAIIPATSFAGDRGRRNGRGRDQSWKCGKFVNCHDARDEHAGTGDAGTSSLTTGAIIDGGILDPGIVAVRTALTMIGGGTIALTVDVRAVIGHEMCAGDETNLQPSV